MMPSYQEFVWRAEDEERAGRAEVEAQILADQQDSRIEHVHGDLGAIAVRENIEKEAWTRYYRRRNQRR